MNIKGSPRDGLIAATLGFFIGFAAVALFGPTANRFQEVMELSPMMVGFLGDLGPRGDSIGFVVFVYLTISALLMAWILKYAIEAAAANGPSRLES